MNISTCLLFTAFKNDNHKQEIESLKKVSFTCSVSTGLIHTNIHLKKSDQIKLRLDNKLSFYNKAQGCVRGYLTRFKFSLFGNIL